MKNNIIITIGRQYGSGGRYIGRKLSEKLGFKFYDKELLTLAAKESGIDEGLFKNADEKPTNSFWSSLAMNAGSYVNRPTPFTDMPINDKLFLIQSDTIKKVASQDSCVIVGRCADRILKDNLQTINIFIHSSIEDKLNRIVNLYNVPESEAKDTMIKKDKVRSSYYNYYTDNSWGQADNYHMSIDSSILGIDGTVEMILTFTLMKYGI